MRVLLIDNYDSFTYNLLQLCQSTLRKDSDEVVVKRNDDITGPMVEAGDFDKIIISPGPGSPEDQRYFGVCTYVLKEVSPRIPTLGVCLGMQGMASVYGGCVVRCAQPMHGKTSMVVHDGKGIFTGLPSSIQAMRYHSLCVEEATLPACLKVTARVAGNSHEILSEHSGSLGVIMGLRHVTYPIEGVQFHPESFATPAGAHLIHNFLYHTT